MCSDFPENSTHTTLWTSEMVCLCINSKARIPVSLGRIIFISLKYLECFFFNSLFPAKFLANQFWSSCGWRVSHPWNQLLCCTASDSFRRLPALGLGQGCSLQMRKSTKQEGQGHSRLRELFCSLCPYDRDRSTKFKINKI